jgi:hypothetical protein
LRNQNESKYGWLRGCLAIGIDMDAVMEEMREREIGHQKKRMEWGF